MEHAPEAIKRHVKLYITVFAALAALTLVTVAVSHLRLPLPKAVAVALTIATVKALLVALFFMHLISERAVIFWILGFTFIFFVAILVLPAFT